MQGPPPLPPAGVMWEARNLKGTTWPISTTGYEPLGETETTGYEPMGQTERTGYGGGLRARIRNPVAASSVFGHTHLLSGWVEVGFHPPSERRYFNPS